MPIGFGLFKLVEGIVDHHLLGIDHVNETVPREQWVYWNIGFLIWGADMLLGALRCCAGAGLCRRANTEALIRHAGNVRPRDR